LKKVLKPNGVVMIRDYGINDHSMIRFNPGHKINERHYARQDGTRTYFFTLEELENIFINCDKDNEKSSAESSILNYHENKESSTLFKKINNEYVFRETVNVKMDIKVPRVYIQAKFVRTNLKLNEKINKI
jgi:methyltransferase-like protein 6